MLEMLAAGPEGGCRVGPRSGTCSCGYTPVFIVVCFVIVVTYTWQNLPPEPCVSVQVSGLSTFVMCNRSERNPVPLAVTHRELSANRRSTW